MGKKKKLLVYLTAGFPDSRNFQRIVNHLGSWGVDGIEIGVPFSDPIADGPTIQMASAAALQKKIDLEKIKKILLKCRSKAELIVMSYYNPIQCYGPEKFCREFSALGVKKLIIPDVLPEEARGIEKIAGKYKIGIVYLIAPTTSPARMRMISQKSCDFVYVVSVTGVTGARKKIPGIERYLQLVRKNVSRPIYVGFGISSGAQVKKWKKYADGFIIGSAVIEIIARGGKWFFRLKNFIQNLRRALN